MCCGIVCINITRFCCCNSSQSILYRQILEPLGNRDDKYDRCSHHALVLPFSVVVTWSGGGRGLRDCGPALKKRISYEGNDADCAHEDGAGVRTTQALTRFNYLDTSLCGLCEYKTRIIQEKQAIKCHKSNTRNTKVVLKTVLYFFQF